MNCRLRMAFWCSDSSAVPSDKVGVYALVSIYRLRFCTRPARDLENADDLRERVKDDCVTHLEQDRRANRLGFHALYFSVKWQIGSVICLRLADTATLHRKHRCIDSLLTFTTCLPRGTIPVCKRNGQAYSHNSEVEAPRPRSSHHSWSTA